MSTTAYLCALYAALGISLCHDCPKLVNVLEGNTRRYGSQLSTPARYVIIHHTDTSRCSSRRDCNNIVRSLQNEHAEDRQSRYEDSGFSFLISDDGVVYKGRGWDFTGAHSPKYNDRSIGIALIGRFRERPPSREQLSATRRLINCGVSRGKLRQNYRLMGHLQIGEGNCPGRALYEVIKEWPNWYPMSDELDESDTDY